MNTEEHVRREMLAVQREQEREAILAFVQGVYQRAGGYAGPRNGHQQIAFALKDEVALLEEQMPDPHTPADADALTSEELDLIESDPWAHLSIETAERLVAMARRVGEVEKERDDALHAFQVRCDQLTVALAERDAAQSRVLELEDMVVTWGVDCEHCALYLDSGYAETVRAERAERERDEAKERVLRLEDTVRHLDTVEQERDQAKAESEGRAQRIRILYEEIFSTRRDRDTARAECERLTSLLRRVLTVNEGGYSVSPKLRAEIRQSLAAPDTAADAVGEW